MNCFNISVGIGKSYSYRVIPLHLFSSKSSLGFSGILWDSLSVRYIILHFFCSLSRERQNMASSWEIIRRCWDDLILLLSLKTKPLEYTIIKDNSNSDSEVGIFHILLVFGNFWYRNQRSNKRCHTEDKLIINNLTILHFLLTVLNATSA